MALALLWYAVDARKWFKGPKINVEHLIHPQVFDGQEVKVDQEDEVKVDQKDEVKVDQKDEVKVDQKDEVILQ